MSRKTLAEILKVDSTAVASWELGKYLPRDGHRRSIADALGTEPHLLFSNPSLAAPPPIMASITNTFADLPGLLMELLATSRQMRALRLAAPYSTPTNVQMDFRESVSDRILAKTLEVQRVEIIYSLDRLKEITSNIFRYDSTSYFVKSYCPGLKEVAPAMGGYFFDDSEFLIGAYWTGIPPHNRPGLRLSGEPFTTYFNAYWEEIWRRGTLLNMKGAHDFSVVRAVALSLGLDEADWSGFLEEARTLELGDGVPPLI